MHVRRCHDTIITAIIRNKLVNKLAFNVAFSTPLCDLGWIIVVCSHIITFISIYIHEKLYFLRFWRIYLNRYKYIYTYLCKEIKLLALNYGYMFIFVR